MKKAILCELPLFIERTDDKWVMWRCSKCNKHIGSEVYDAIGAYFCQSCGTAHAFCVPENDEWLCNRVESYVYTKFCADNNLSSFEGYCSFHNVKLPEEMRKFFYV